MVAQKSKLQTFVHVLAKYRPISNIFHLHILWKIRNNAVTKYITTPQLRRYTTLWYKSVKSINIWWRYEQLYGA